MSTTPPTIPTIVLTGGPCGGKSTVLKLLQTSRPGVQVVPEAATMLLQGGYPLPGREVEFSEHWRFNFQGAILDLQHRLGAFWAKEAWENYKQLLVLDRGILDGAAYTPGGVAEFAGLYQLNHEQVLSRYQMVLHLESLATGDPTSYGSQGNQARQETLQEAQELEHKTRAAWEAHPNWRFIPSCEQISQKADLVSNFIDEILSSH